MPATERARASLELLYSISRELTAKLDSRQLLRRILQLTIQNAGAASGSILVLDEEGRVSDGSLAFDGKVHDHTAEQLTATYERGLAGWVVEHRESVLLKNTLKDPRWLRRSSEVDAGKVDGAPRSAICIPLMLADRVVGVLTLVHPEPDHFTEDDLDLLRAIADQASIAVENARLFLAEKNRREFANTLQEIARVISSALDPALVLPQVLQQLERVIRYDNAVIWIIEREGLRMAAARERGEALSAAEHTIPFQSDLLAGQVINNRKSMVLSDVQQHPGWMKDDLIPGSTEARSWIGVPLLVRDQAVGMLSVYCRQADVFGKPELDLVTAFADQAATAVSNAQLFAESQRQLRATHALAETARVISGSLNLDEVLQRILTQTMRTLEVEAASLALVDENSGGLEFKVASGESADQIIGVRLKAGEGIAGWIAEHGEHLVVPDVNNDPRFFSGVDEQIDFETRVIAGAPIRLGERTIGVLEAVNPRQREFSDDQVELLLGIAGLAGTAIAHAQLFSDTQAARQRYASLFEDSIDPILISDLNGMVSDANRSAETFLGYERDQLVRREVLSLHQPDRERLPDDLHLLKNGDTVAYESEASHAQGYPLPIEVHVKRINIGRQPSLQWILRDISERHALDELRQDLTSMIFHDLRSPLGNVLSSLEVLRTSLDDKDESLQAVFGIALRSGRRLSRLVESLLDLGQLETGKAVLHKSSSQINPLIIEAVDEVHPVAEAKDHVLGFELVPSHHGPLEMDVDMIRRVLINLLENAIKYTRPGGNIHISATQDEAELVVHIRDNGPGISARDQRMIFDKFARVQREGRPKGLGLGLAFCRLAVEAHGGRIWLESESGRGATFSFALPV